jgi:hypothetical protein
MAIAVSVRSLRAIRRTDRNPAKGVLKRFQQSLAELFARSDCQIRILREIGQSVHHSDFAMQEITHEERAGEANSAERPCFKPIWFERSDVKAKHFRLERLSELTWRQSRPCGRRRRKNAIRTSANGGSCSPIIPTSRAKERFADRFALDYDADVCEIADRTRYAERIWTTTFPHLRGQYET